MLVVHREVAILWWGLVDGVEPHVATRQGGDLATELVGGMVGHCISGPRGRLYPRRVQRLTVGQHGAVRGQRGQSKREAKRVWPVAVNSPSASSVATARPLGPNAEMRMGTSIGRAGACPSGCIIRIRLPCHVTAAPVSSPRNAATYSRRYDQLAGALPRARAPANPVPNATATRPGASAVSAAVAEALTIGWRRVGTSTPGPKHRGGAFGRQREHHPHVGAFVRCVEQPGPVVAELLGDRDVLRGMQRGGELGGDLHLRRHGVRP